MKCYILLLALMLSVATPAMAASPGSGSGSGSRSGSDMRHSGKDSDRKDKPVVIIRGKGGKVTKVKKPRPKQ